MRIVDLSMTVEECDSAPFAPDEKYFKLRPIINWEDKGFVSNVVQMTVHVGTHIDSPHHFFRDKPSIEKLPLEPMVGKAVVLDITAKGKAHAAILPEDLDKAEKDLNQKGVSIDEGGMLFLRTDWPKGHDTTDPKW
ncbi:MAG: cyclase family protein, partial [Deltaproteobacteria bacterium]|nr:cyclase family protein [Deltaproteobacteria bacterium]